MATRRPENASVDRRTMLKCEMVLACVLCAGTISACVGGRVLQRVTPRQAPPSAAQPTQASSQGLAPANVEPIAQATAAPPGPDAAPAATIATTPTEAGAQSAVQTTTTAIHERLAAVTALPPRPATYTAPPTPDPADRVDRLLKQLESANNTADPLDDLSKQ
jgi:hypothetical protein